MAHGSDERLTQLYRFFQHSFDGKMSAVAATRAAKRTGLRYVVNGHSHFPSMQPLGRIDGKPAVYFNTGTWRAVHQIGHDLGGRPSFLAVRRDELRRVLPDRRQARPRLRVVDRRDGRAAVNASFMAVRAERLVDAREVARRAWCRSMRSAR